METFRLGFGDFLREHGEKSTLGGLVIFGKLPQLPRRLRVHFHGDWRRCFLLNLRRSGDLADAAERAGVKPEHIETRRARYGDFEAECQQMLREYAERQEARARRRGERAETFALQRVE